MPRINDTEVSETTYAYYELWRGMLHATCGTLVPCTCEKRAFGLVVGRLQNMRNGMPDLHPDEERKIWELAWKIHYDHGGSNIMTPPWCEEIPGGHFKCQCFFIAQHQLESEAELSSRKAAIKAIVFDPDDMWFEPRYD